MYIYIYLHIYIKIICYLLLISEYTHYLIPDLMAAESFNIGELLLKNIFTTKLLITKKHQLGKQKCC